VKPDIKPGDYHLICNDWEKRYESEMKCYKADGSLLWTIPCLAKGLIADYSQKRGDTPPGLYVLSRLIVTQPDEPKQVWNAYGKFFWDMSPGSGAEEKYGRSGCGIHGGGTLAPMPLAPYQELKATHGCIRLHNADLEKRILPIWEETRKKKATIWLTVNQF